LRQDLSMYLSLASNSGFFFLSLLSPGITGMCLHTWLLWVLKCFRGSSPTQLRYKFPRASLVAVGVVLEIMGFSTSVKWNFWFSPHFSLCVITQYTVYLMVQYYFSINLLLISNILTLICRLENIFV
jgi:hypothetical protein